jgi:uncharacterized membrane protein
VVRLGKIRLELDRLVQGRDGFAQFGRAAYYFDVSLTYPILLLVLWALGVSMIVLALLIWLPIPLLAVLSIAVTTLQNLMDGVNATKFGPAAWAWNLLHQPGTVPLAGATIVVGYPLVPWVAVMALGFCLRPLFLKDRAVRRRYLTVIGAAATLAFVVIRAFNGYGDPQPWAVQRSAIFTVLSFLNTIKYPPSLDFLLMTLGPSLLALAWFDRPGLKPSDPLVVIGRVPLFYFVVHIYAAHAAAVLLALARYGIGALAFIFQPVPSMGGLANCFRRSLVTTCGWYTSCGRSSSWHCTPRADGSRQSRRSDTTGG